MCMLTFLPPNVLPNTDRLRNGTVSNRDGHGWAIVVLGDDGNGSHILTGHSMNAEAAIEAFKRSREKHPEGPALFHSRYTTGGLVDESNCHPYVVNGDPRTILAHNGVLPGMGQPFKDERSDTRYFCEMLGDLLYPGGEPGASFNLNSKRGRRRLREWLGNPNKFVVLTVDPAFKRNFYVVNAEQGVWEDDGCWYSNTGYKQKTYGIGTAYAGGWGWDDEYWGTVKAPKTPGKRWWDDMDDTPMYATGSQTANVWDRLAKSVKRVFDKSRLTSFPLAPDQRDCAMCDSKNAVDATLNYCHMCGTCGDCWLDAYLEFGSDACDCLWPMGTHPGRQRALEAAFKGGGSDTGWPTDIGPPVDDATEGARAALDDDDTETCLCEECVCDGTRQCQCMVCANTGQCEKVTARLAIAATPHTPEEK